MPYPESAATARLMLRRPRPTDEDAFLAVWSDPDVRRALRPGADFNPAYIRHRFQHHLEHWTSHGFGLWLIEAGTGRQAVGWVGPTHPDFVPELADEIEIGWTLLRSSWGQGIATEAARTATAAAFEHLRPARLISLIHPANVRSVAVAKRLGMSNVASVRHAELELDLRLFALDTPTTS